MFDINDVFSHREIAIALWLVAGLLFVNFNADVRSAFIGVLRAVFAPKLLFLFAAFAVWVGFLSFFLAWFGLWTISELKATVLWYLFSGLALLARSIEHRGRSDKSQPDTSFFRSIIFDNFRVTVVVEFVGAAYSFSLFAELLFVPLIVVLSSLYAFAELEEKYTSARRPIEYIFLAIAVGLVWHFVHQTINDGGDIFSIATLRGVLVPIELSILSVPVFYLAYCYSAWETFDIRLGVKTYQSDELKRMARRKFFRAFFLRPPLFNRAVRQFQILPAESEDDIVKIIAGVREYERLKRTPPTIEPHLGWCPYQAELFLSAAQLATNDYHFSGFDDEWLAESSLRQLGRRFPTETLHYVIKGNANAASTLKLTARLPISPTPIEGLQVIEEAADLLTSKATSLAEMPGRIRRAIRALDNAFDGDGLHEIHVEVRRYEEANTLDVEFTIVVPAVSATDQDEIN
ncbi:MAG: hypothetical protein C0606_03480 [Hyphomicrobiales bacterium]|nr:MAG: hypothetical protein C0606_03480 [Hyphomicrobiales bacterium]